MKWLKSYVITANQYFKDPKHFPVYAKHYINNKPIKNQQ